MSNRTIAYAEFDEPPAALAQAVDDGLDRYNRQAAPLADVRPLGTFASDAEGRTIGGAVGRTWGRCCELQQLWVDAAQRRQGIGARLVRAFEDRAQARGCDTFYLETFSFQAPSLYASLGYHVAHELEGFGPGIRKFLMVRKIAATKELTR